MTDAQKKLIELDLKKEEITAYYDELREVLQAVTDEIGVEGHFQADDGTVFQIQEPAGRFVHVEKLSYIRTRRSGEKRGDLSLTKARELGYEVE